MLGAAGLGGKPACPTPAPPARPCSGPCSRPPAAEPPAPSEGAPRTPRLPPAPWASLLGTRQEEANSCTPTPRVSRTSAHTFALASGLLSPWRGEAAPPAPTCRSGTGGPRVPGTPRPLPQLGDRPQEPSAALGGRREVAGGPAGPEPPRMPLWPWLWAPGGWGGLGPKSPGEAPGPRWLRSAPPGEGGALAGDNEPPRADLHRGRGRGRGGPRSRAVQASVCTCVSRGQTVTAGPERGHRRRRRRVTGALAGPTGRPRAALGEAR